MEANGSWRMSPVEMGAGALIWECLSDWWTYRSTRYSEWWSLSKLWPIDVVHYRWLRTMSANIRDIQVVREFRAALLEFMDEANSALELMSVELQRAMAWIEQDRPHYWTNQLRKGFDGVAEARSALNRCQMRTVAGQRSSCIEEKQAFAKSKIRLQHCQDQLENVKRWSTKLRHEGNEFRGRLAGLKRMIESDLPRACALLEKTAEVLEAYAEMLPPTNQT